jgi:hypothetical protein
MIPFKYQIIVADEATGDLGRAWKGNANMTKAPTPVSREEFTRAVAAFIGRRSGVDPTLIHEDCDYVADRLLDSLGIMTLFHFAEEHFGVSFAMEAFDIRESNTAARLYRHYVQAVVEAVQSESA